MELDFSRLDGLAYRGFTSEAARDTFIEQGFMVMEDEKSPFNVPVAMEGNVPDTAKSAAMRDAVARYKERHPLPQNSLDYWEDAVRDLCGVAKQFDNDPQMVCLLREAYGELEREYYARKRTTGEVLP